MNKAITALAALFALSTPTAFANEETTGFYLSLGHNWTNFDDSRPTSNGKGVYFGAGYQTSNHLGFELKHTDIGPTFTSLSSVYRYQPRNTDSFYWKAGLGKYSQFASNGTTLNLGAGYEAHINETVSLVLGVDGIYQPNKFKNFDWSPYFGFNFFFGDTTKSSTPVVTPTKPVLLDSDNDGVVNNLDECLSTPTGATVGSNGCQLDDDKDGIVNRIDQCLTTPTGAKVDELGCRIVLSENVSIKLNVQFANNSNEVTNQYNSEIKKVADFMQQYPDTTVVIEGHTDSKGAASYNKKLSQQRATAVMNYLVSQFNIEAARVSAKGVGESFPISDNDTAEGRAMNRRVQAEIKTTTSK